jgi:hypothetical protein
MGGRTRYEIPAKLQEAQERFEQWRSSQAGRRPIPEPLWVLASELVSSSAWSLPHGSGAASRLQQAQAAHAGDGFDGGTCTSRATSSRRTDRIVGGKSM